MNLLYKIAKKFPYSIITVELVPAFNVGEHRPRVTITSDSGEMLYDLEGGSSIEGLLERLVEMI